MRRGLSPPTVAIEEPTGAWQPPKKRNRIGYPSWKKPMYYRYKPRASRIVGSVSGGRREPNGNSQGYGCSIGKLIGVGEFLPSSWTLNQEVWNRTLILQRGWKWKSTTGIVDLALCLRLGKLHPHELVNQPDEKQTSTGAGKAHDSTHYMIRQNFVCAVRRFRQRGVSEPELFDHDRLIAQQVGNKPCARDGSYGVPRVAYYQDLIP